MDTIEQIERDANNEGVCTTEYETIYIRILIQIAKELRVLAQRSE